MAKDKAGSLAIEVGVDDSKVTKTLASVEREVRQSIKMFRDYDNALRNSDKTLKDFDKSMNANQKSMKMVEQSIAGVKTKMAELENKTDNLATATEKERAHYDRLQRSLAKMESDYNQLSKASGNLKRQLAYEKTGVNQAEDAYRKLKEEQKLTFSEGTKGIKQARERLRGYRDEQKQLRTVISTLRSSVDELSKEFGENSTEVLGAKKKLHDYQGELKTCTKNMNDFRATGGGAFTKVAEKAASLGRSMSMSVTAPVVTGLGAATAKATEFGDSMHKMQVLSGASKDEMKKLSEASKEAAKTYGVSTKEYNASVTELLKTGYSVKDSMKIMKAGLQASKASGEGLEVVLDKTSSTLKIFNMDAKDAGKVTDKLTYIANASKSSITELGDGLSKVGPVAHNLGMSIDETSSALGVLQNNGFQVDVAATGLRSGLANLVDPSKANTEAFQKLGINLNEVKQKGIHLPKLLGDMDKATQGMTKSQKEALIAQAFGKESMAQWTALMGGTARKELKEFTEGAKKSNGTVSKMASDMSGTGKEALNKFKGSLEVLGITFGEKVLPKLTPLVEGVTKLLNKFAEASPSTQTFILATAGIAAAIGPLSMMLGGLVTTITLIATSVGAVVAGVVALGAAFGVAYVKCKPFRDLVNKLVKGFVQGCKDIWNAIKVIPGQFKKAFGKAWGSFKDSMNSMKNKASTAWENIKSSFKDGVDTTLNRVKNWAVVKGFRDKFNASMKETGSFSKSFKAGMKGMIDEVRSRVEKWTIVQKFKDKWETVKSKTGNFIKDMKRGISDMVKKIADSVRNSSIGKAFSSVFTKSWNVVAGILQKIANGAAWVLDKLGADDVASKLKNWGSTLKKYSTGTGVGGHPGGLMMVNDAAGSNYQELVVRPNGEAFIPQGRNVVMYGEPGTQVLRGDKTANLMNSLGIRPYAKGTGFINKAVDFGKGLVKKAKDVIGDVMDYMGHPGKLVSKVFSHFVGVPDGIKYGVDVAKGTITRAKDALKAKIKGLFDAMDTGDIDGTWGDLGSNNWFQIHGQWVREWQYRLLEPIIKKYGFQVTDGGRRTWDNFDHSKGKAMDIALPNNPLGLYWKVAQQIDKMPLVSYVNSNLKSSYGHKGLFTPSNFEPRADHIHVSFKKELLSPSELRGNKGRAGGSLGNPGGAGVARWRPYVIKALRANGLPTTPAYINAWMRQIQTESGGNPRAVGGNDGLNEGNATGLLQVKPGTFQANKHPGHGNIFNGYDNMLAAMRYAKNRYGYSGMLQAIGHGHGYEKGGLVLQHQLAQIAEGNKPEMVIPLTDTSRSVQLIRQAQRFVGEKHFEERDDKTHENEMLKRMLTKMQETNELLKALLLKDSDVYLDGNKVSAQIDARARMEQTRRAIANGMI